MRKQSPATQLRYAKAELARAKKLLTLADRELKLRREWGDMMANICFNLSQNINYYPQHRQSMKAHQEGWDAIRKVNLI